MKRGFLAAGLLFALGAVAPAQDDAEFVKWMKTTGAESGALRKMEQKTGAEAAASAEKIAAAYEGMKGYWAKRGGAADAEKLSADGHAAALELAAAAKAGDAAKAHAAFQALGGTCKSCHDVHREKNADGTYKIK